MERIRVYTEDTPTIRNVVAKYLEGATVYHGDGLWRGNWEKSLIVEVITFSDVTAKAVENMIKAIKATGQEAVLVTREPISAALH